MNLTVDLSGLRPEVASRVIRQCRHEDKAAFDLGRIRQLKMKKLMDAVNGPGMNRQHLRQTMIIDEDQWNRFMQVYGQRCWSDPDFAPWVLKQEQHSDFRVKDTPTKLQVGWTGSVEEKLKIES